MILLHLYYNILTNLSLNENNVGNEILSEKYVEFCHQTLSTE